MAPKSAPGHSTTHVPVIAASDLEYGAALAVAVALGILPAAKRAKVVDRLSKVLGTILWRTNRASVRRVRRHLSCLFGYQELGPELEGLVRDHLILTSWNALLLHLLPAWCEAERVRLLDLEGLHQLDQVRQENGLVLVLGYHYGAYGYALAATLCARGYPTCMVGFGPEAAPRPGNSRLYRRLYWPRIESLRRQLPIITVHPGEELPPELREILERKTHVIHLLADQYYPVCPGQAHPANLMPLRLLNHTVYLDVTGVQQAKKAGAQPFTAIAVKGDGQHRVVIAPMPWASPGTAVADVVGDLQVYLNRLEQSLLEDPGLWRDLHRTDLLPRLGIFEESCLDG